MCFVNLLCTQSLYVSNKIPNYKKTEELTLKLIKGQAHYKYYTPTDIIAEERFYHLVCKQTRDAKGNTIPLLDKEGNPIYYQLQYFLESDTDTLNEEQKQMLLQDPRYRDPSTGEIKKFPYKELLSVIRVLTEVDGKEWLKVKWMWEGLRKDKGIETKAFDLGTYHHPLPTNEPRQVNPNDIVHTNLFHGYASANCPGPVVLNDVDHC